MNQLEHYSLPSTRRSMWSLFTSFLLMCLLYSQHTYRLHTIEIIRCSVYYGKVGATYTVTIKKKLNVTSRYGTSTEVFLLKSLIPKCHSPLFSINSSVCACLYTLQSRSTRTMADISTLKFDTPSLNVSWRSIPWFCNWFYFCSPISNIVWLIGEGIVPSLMMSYYRFYHADH